MNEPEYNAEIITNYLLGTLSGTETERFDELSLTDTAFADALTAVESELVDSYVLDELPGDVRQQFENHYLATPHRKEKVKFAEAFQLFGERQEVGSTIAKSEKTNWLGTLKYFFGPSRLQWGFAAVLLVLAIVGIWLWLQNARLQEQLRAAESRNIDLAQREQQLQKQLATLREPESTLPHTEPTPESLPPESPNTHRVSVMSFVLTPQLRGGQQQTIVNLSADTTAVAFRIVLEPNEFSNFRVVLKNQAGEQLWRSGNLKAQSNNQAKTLSISIPTSRLQPGHQVLQVTGTAGNREAEVLGDYSFTVSGPKPRHH